MKKRIDFWVEDEVLKRWDEQRIKYFGGPRAQFMRSAIDFYLMFLKQELEGTSNSEIKKQLDAINEKIQVLTNQKERNDSRMLEIEGQLPLDEIPNATYLKLKESIISVLKNFGSQSIKNIPYYLDPPDNEIEGSFLFLILQRMKKDEIVDLNKFYEWELIE
jgi:hypothetical protein